MHYMINEPSPMLQYIDLRVCVNIFSTLKGEFKDLNLLFNIIELKECDWLFKKVLLLCHIGQETQRHK